MSASLERNYRRLLACYPANYRREYEEEILTVLLAGAGERQRRPGLRETVDLLVHAVWARFAPGGPVEVDPRWWRDAAAVFGLVTSVLLFAKHLRPIASQVGFSVKFPWVMTIAPMEVLRVVAWLAVVVAVLCGWRLVAAFSASAIAFGETVNLTVDYVAGSHGPLPVLARAWPIALAVFTAAALALAVRGRRATAVLGRGRTITVGVAGLVAGLGSIVFPLLSTDEGDVITSVPEPYFTLIAAGTYAVVAVLLAVAIVRIEPPVRRRVLALAAPTVTLLAIVQLGLDYAFSGAIYTIPPVLPEGAQWPLLITLPVVVFAAGVLIVRHRERGRGPTLD